MLAAKAYFVNLQLVLHAMRIFAIVYKHYVVIIITAFRPAYYRCLCFSELQHQSSIMQMHEEREEGIVLIFQILLSVHEECWML